jgi:hypothetical protein
VVGGGSVRRRDLSSREIDRERGRGSSSTRECSGRGKLIRRREWGLQREREEELTLLLRLREGGSGKILHR